MTRKRTSLRLMGDFGVGRLFEFLLVQQPSGVGDELLTPTGIGVAAFQIMGEGGDGVEVSCGVGGEAGAAFVGDLGLNGGHVVRGTEGLSDFAHTQLHGLLCG